LADVVLVPAEAPVASVETPAVLSAETTQRVPPEVAPMQAAPLDPRDHARLALAELVGALRAHVRRAA
jgi:hypothetical protein